MNKKNIIIDEDSNALDVSNAIAALQEMMKTNKEQLRESLQNYDSEKALVLLEFFKVIPTNEAFFEDFLLNPKNHHSIIIFKAIIENFSKDVPNNLLFDTIISNSWEELFDNNQAIENLMDIFPETMQWYIQQNWERLSPNSFVYCMDKGYIEGGWSINDYCKSALEGNGHLLELHYLAILDHPRFEKSLSNLNDKIFSKLIQNIIYTFVETLNFKQMKKIKPDLSLLDIIEFPDLDTAKYIGRHPYDLSKEIYGFLIQDLIEKDEQKFNTEKFEKLITEFFKMHKDIVSEKIYYLIEAFVQHDNGKMVELFNLKYLQQNKETELKLPQWEKFFMNYSLSQHIKNIDTKTFKENKPKI